MTHQFTVPIINDRIAAQPERNINISVATGLGYTASTDSVTVTVVDDDVARVSISPIRDRVTEGDTIIFTITRNLATAQATSITLTLTHNGDFFSPAPAMDRLMLGDNYADTGIDLNLAYRHKRDGKVYYYLDRFRFGFNSNNDAVTHTLLDDLLNSGFDTINTQPDGHDGSDDERSVIIDGYALVLPTGTEIQDLLSAGGDNPVPGGWANGVPYWAAGLAMDNAGNAVINRHDRVVFAISSPFYGQIIQVGDGDIRTYAFFQVLTAQRTIIVDLPAGQMDVMVEVATIDTDDSITDGSLTAELMAATGSPIEFDSTVSEVVIQHNNSVVTITGPGGAISGNC